jgi:hypothetical protein
VYRAWLCIEGFIAIAAKSRRTWLIWTVAFIALVGCSDGRPSRVPVSGQVVIDGKPLVHGFIRFLPEQKERVSTGDLDRNGRFVLTCFENRDGAVVGKHRVEVYAAEGVDEERIRWHAPKRYCNWATSKLEQEITGPTDAITIQLSWNGGKPFVE